MNTLWEKVWERGQGTSLSVEDACFKEIVRLDGVHARMRMLLVIAGRHASPRPVQVAYVAVVRNGPVPLGFAVLLPGADRALSWPPGLVEGAEG